MPRQNNARTYYDEYGDLEQRASRPFLEITPPTAERMAEIERDQEELDREYRAMDAAAQEATQREVARLYAEELGVGNVPRRFQGGAVCLNKTQLREIMAHANVWEYVPSVLRTRITNSVASDGVLFQLSGTQRNELRNALAHGRARRPLSDRLQSIFAQTTRWS